MAVQASTTDLNEVNKEQKAAHVFYVCHPKHPGILLHALCTMPPSLCCMTLATALHMAQFRSSPVRDPDRCAVRRCSSAVMLTACRKLLCMLTYTARVVLTGFQSGSNSISRLAPTRFKPQPPALLDSRNTNIYSSASHPNVQ